MSKPIVLTQAERDERIRFIIAVGSELGIGCDHVKLKAMTDEQLEREADWYWELTWK